jgi:hypothetical protein
MSSDLRVPTFSRTLVRRIPDSGCSSHSLLVEVLMMPVTRIWCQCASTINSVEWGSVASIIWVLKLDSLWKSIVLGCVITRSSSHISSCCAPKRLKISLVPLTMIYLLLESSVCCSHYNTIPLVIHTSTYFLLLPWCRSSISVLCEACLFEILVLLADKFRAWCCIEILKHWWMRIGDFAVPLSLCWHTA